MSQGPELGELGVRRRNGKSKGRRMHYFPFKRKLAKLLKMGMNLHENVRCCFEIGIFRKNAENFNIVYNSIYFNRI